MQGRFIAIAVLSVLMVNCAKKSSSSDSSTASAVTITPGAPVIAVPPGTTPYVPTQTGVGYSPGNTFIWGGTGDFVFDSLAVYQQYTQRNVMSLNEITNVKINLNLANYGGSYGGQVTIRYALDGQLFEGYFTSGNDPSSTQYNVMLNGGAGNAWHGFFEDFMGAIVVVVDSFSSVNTASGSVWFKNFAIQPGFGPHPPTYCWFVSFGPYDCRAWPLGWGVNTTAGVYPDNGYTRLGTFSGVPTTSAFNGMVY